MNFGGQTMAKTTLFAIALVAGIWLVSPAQSQHESASRTTVFSSLRAGEQVIVKDAGQMVEISTIAGVEAGTHTVVEIGDNFIVLRDVAKVTTSRVPVYAIKSIVEINGQPE
jgi:preprotein translocase subunit YajC